MTQEQTPTPLVELHGVARRYQVGPATVTALDSVDLRIDEGEFVVVLGPSGSGKTTLLNVIGALDTPSEGRIIVGGQDISSASRGQLFDFRRRTVSFIFQSFNLFPGLTARENVEFGIVHIKHRPQDVFRIGAEDRRRVAVADRGFGEP